jgi:signal transduction histidine kinase
MLDEIVRLLQQIKSVGDNIAHDLRSPLAVMRTKLERGLAADSGQELRAVAEGALGDLDQALARPAREFRGANETIFLNGSTAPAKPVTFPVLALA